MNENEFDIDQQLSEGLFYITALAIICKIFEIMRNQSVNDTEAHP